MRHIVMMCACSQKPASVRHCSDVWKGLMTEEDNRQQAPVRGRPAQDAPKGTSNRLRSIYRFNLMPLSGRKSIPADFKAAIMLEMLLGIGLRAPRSKSAIVCRETFAAAARSSWLHPSIARAPRHCSMEIEASPASYILIDIN